MKRHINSLLQRKRVDFDSAQNPGKSFQRSEARSDAERQVLVKDGYDWLQHIHVEAAPVVHLPKI